MLRSRRKVYSTFQCDIRPVYLESKVRPAEIEMTVAVAHGLQDVVDVDLGLSL
jgi:hypothetical protein